MKRNPLNTAKCSFYMHSSTMKPGSDQHSNAFVYLKFDNQKKI